MKKTTIIFLLLALIAGLFISCSQEMTVDADVHNKINDIDTFCINGKYFSTLQAAVDYFKDSKAMKAPGDNDNVIYLTRNASGPGADIVDIQGLVIDFAGFTYSFTNVTAIQGETGGKFGLSITDGSEVTLKGLEQIDLFDSTADLTMVYIEGSDTSLTIEDAPKMVVEPTQYVFWAANGATLTIGSTDATKEAAITGKIAATGGETEESAPSITVQAKTTITGSVEATKANVTLSGKTVVNGTVSATQSMVEANETSKVTGKIEASASKVSVSGAAKIEVDLTAKDNSEVVINTVEAGAGTSVIKTMDKEETSTVVVAGGTVNVEEVAEGSDDAIEVSGDATVTGDDVQQEVITTYVAKINGKSAYTTMEDAIKAASTTGHRDEIILLQAITENIEIPQGRDVIINLNSYNVGSNVTVTVDGSVVVRAESERVIEGSLSLKSGSVTVLEGGTYYVDFDVAADAEFTITGGTYNNFDPTAFVPKYCEITGTCPTWTVTRIAKDDAVAEIAGYYYKSLQDAIDDAEDGETVKILNDIAISDTVNISKSINLNGDNHTITRSLEASAAGGFALNFAGDNNTSLNVVVDKLSVTAINSNGVRFQDYIAKAVVNDCNFNATNRTPAYIGDGDTVNTVYVELNNTNMTMTGSRDGCPWFNTAIGVTNGATAIVTGGKYTGPMAAYIMSSGGKLTINEGSMFVSTGESGYAGDGIRVDRNYEEESVKGLDYSDSVLTINGGSFKNISHINLWNSGNKGDQSWDDKVLVYIKGGDFENYSIAGVSSPWCLAEITGGTFDADPSAYVAEGYYAKPQGTNPETWIVIPDTPQVSVVKNGESVGQIMSLALFRDKVNAGNTYEGYTITLLVDVDLENVAWTPIGTSAHPFSGVFNGGGHTVKNFTAHGDSDQGLFGYISGSDTNIVYKSYVDIINYDEDFSFEPSVNPDGFKEEYYSAVVKNIVIENANVEANTKFAGTLAGETFNTLISDVTVKSSNVTAEKYAGGIVGNVGATVIYKSTVEKGNDVKATIYNAGGIVGGMSYNAGYYPSAVISSKNASDLNMENVSCGCFGGIVGLVNATTTNGRGNVIADCINTGKVSIAVSDGTSAQVGGIAASGQGLSIVGLCENRGNISLSSSVGAANKVIGNAGGIVGGSGGGETLADKVILYGCSNSGNISASTTYDSKLIFAGGLIGTAAGSAKPNSENDIIIANCSNSGVVTSDGYKSEFAACSAGDLIISMNEFASLEKLSDALPSYIEQYHARVTVAQNTVSDTSGALLIGHVRNLYLVGLTPITINFTGDFPAKVGGDNPAESMQIYVYDNSNNLADVNIVIPEGKTVGSDTGNNQVFIHGKNINFTNNGTYYGGVKINSDPSNESVVTNNGTWLRNGVNTIDLNNCASWVENGTHDEKMAIINSK